MKFNKWIIGMSVVIALCVGSSSRAQTVSITAPTIGLALQAAGLAANLASNTLIQVGQPFTINGSQTFLITTNLAGNYVISTSGTAGNETFTPPTNPSQFVGQGTTWVNANNPTNISYYGTNEIDARIGAIYLQNSGQAAVSISIQKYGLFGNGNIGIGAGLIQGNNAGKSGTAGGFGEFDYRKPIGDVAAVGGLLVGYDNWNRAPFGGAKAGLEYRQNQHLGEFIDAAWCFEPNQSDRGLTITGGVVYAF